MDLLRQVARKRTAATVVALVALAPIASVTNASAQSNVVWVNAIGALVFT